MKKIFLSLMFAVLPCIVQSANSYRYRDNSVVITQDQIAVSDTNATSVFELGPYQVGSVQCVHAGVNVDRDATFVLQVSNDNSNWDSVSGASTTTVTTGGSSTWIVDPLVSRYGRVYVSTSSSAGTLDCIEVFKRD